MLKRLSPRICLVQSPLSVSHRSAKVDAMSYIPRRLSLVTDGAFEELKESYLSSAKKKLWKDHFLGADGARIKVQAEHVDQEVIFVCLKKNKKYMVISNEMARAEGIDFTVDSDDMDDTIDANMTGNHKSKAWNVRIPTKAGEPVRG